MILPGATPIAMLFLLIVHSWVASASSSSNTDSLSSSNTDSLSVSTTASSASSNTSSTVQMPESSQTASVSQSDMSPSASPTNTMSSSMTPGGGGSSISPTTSGIHSVDMTSSVSVPDVEWSEWRPKHVDGCKKECCDVGGPALHQIRNCTIHRQRCNLTECQNYGSVEQYVSCYNACAHCMPNRNSGFVKAAPGFSAIIAALFICTIIVNKRP